MLIKKKRKKFKKKKTIIKKTPVLSLKKKQKESLILKLVKLQLSIKPQFNFRINFSLEKYI